MSAKTLGLVGGASVAAVGAVVAAAAPAEAVYHTPWSRTDAYNYASTGIDEAYEFGGGKWNDDNTWQTWPTEGADCSGYASKVWAVPSWTAIGTNAHPHSTLTWYGQSVDGSVNISMSASSSYQMDVWVYRVSSGGPSDHMGTFEGSTNGSGQYKTWHASSEATGIKSSYQSLSTLNSYGAKRFKRANW